MFFKRKQTTIKCSLCGKGIDPYQFFVLRQYKGEEEFDGLIVEEIKFCSVMCLKEFSNKHNTIKHVPEEINRCASYYDCKQIDNLRGMCEKGKRVIEQEKEGFLISPLINFCDPANAGIIKSTLNLYKQNKANSVTNTIQFIITAVMTGLTIWLTIQNLSLVKNDKSVDLLNNIDKEIKYLREDLNHNK